jgi:site-specific DNA-methyltransferase (adenine-specific)
MKEINKLYQGDCLEVMDKLIDEGVKVDAIITDPP